MALALEDLAARVEELAHEKASTAQHVAALEHEVVTLRAALANRPLAALDAPPQLPNGSQTAQGVCSRPAPCAGCGPARSRG